VIKGDPDHQGAELKFSAMRNDSILGNWLDLDHNRDMWMA